MTFPTASASPAVDATPRIRAHADPVYLILLSLGVVAWYFPAPQTAIPVHTLLIMALIEELFFRFTIQELLLRRKPFSASIGPLTLANAATSVLFSAAHLIYHSPQNAMLVFFPSLAFGYCWERYRRLWPVWMLHFFYNYCLFHREDIYRLFM